MQVVDVNGNMFGYDHLEIIGANGKPKTIGGGGVTSVTGTAPIASSGGTTPAISIATANTSTTGAISSTDWNTFNGKQAALVSGTNIKTVNSTSLLGSGNVLVQSPLVISLSAISATAVTGTTANAIASAILIPANTFNTSGIIDIMGRYQKTGTAGGQNLRLYVNTSSSLTGATLVANFYNGTNINAGAWRTANIFSNTINFYSLTGATNSDLGTNAGTTATATFNTNVDNYIIFAVQLVNGSDSCVLQYHKVLKYA